MWLTDWIFSDVIFSSSLCLKELKCLPFSEKKKSSWKENHEKKFFITLKARFNNTHRPQPQLFKIEWIFFFSYFIHFLFNLIWVSVNFHFSFFRSSSPTWERSHTWAKGGKYKRIKNSEFGRLEVNRFLSRSVQTIRFNVESTTKLKSEKCCLLFYLLKPRKIKRVLNFCWDKGYDQ